MEQLNELDAELFGLLIRKARRKRHIANLQQFSEYIFSRTGYRISKGALQRVEAGEQELSASALCAVSLALFDRLPTFGDERGNLDAIGMSAPATWLDLQEHPDKWPGRMEPQE